MRCIWGRSAKSTFERNRSKASGLACWRSFPTTEATRIVGSTPWFADTVYVLHVFQKKSKAGIRTPQAEIELVRQRLKRAAELNEQGEK